MLAYEPSNPTRPNFPLHKIEDLLSNLASDSVEDLVRSSLHSFAAVT